MKEGLPKLMNVQKTKQNRIDDKTLERLRSIQNKTLDSVICYLWLNEINTKEVINIIDAVELIFTDGDKLVLVANEEQEGLVSVEYHFEEQKALLNKTFGGKIKLFKVTANSTEMWKGVINTKLLNVRMNKDKDTGHYLCDEFIFEFENQEMRLIQVHPIDGLILDYYEII